MSVAKAACLRAWTGANGVPKLDGDKLERNDDVFAIRRTSARGEHEGDRRVRRTVVGVIPSMSGIINNDAEAAEADDNGELAVWRGGRLG